MYVCTAENRPTRWFISAELIDVIHRSGDMQESTCKVSIIIPVRNGEKTAGSALESLVLQDMSPEEMQVVIVDDGSDDGTVQVIGDYRDRLSIELIREDQKGPAAARNCAMSRARGRYLMFLDADDSYDTGTVRSVTDFFDLHKDETDLVFYPERRFTDAGQAADISALVFGESGIYDLKDQRYCFGAGKGMNFCIKNQGEQNPLFDEDPGLIHEGEAFAAQVLRRLETAGWCSTGAYIRSFRPDSLESRYFHAYYTFEGFTAYYQRIFDSYAGRVPDYLQALYVSDLDERLSGDRLYPYHYDAERYEASVRKLASLLARVEDRVILNHPGVDDLHRDYFLNAKPGEPAALERDSEGLAALRGSEVLCRADSVKVILRRFSLRNGTVRIMAYTKSRILDFADDPELYIVLTRSSGDTERVKLPLRDSSWSYYRAKVPVNRSYLFEYSAEVSDISAIRLEAVLDGEELPVELGFSYQVRFSKKHKRLTYYDQGYRFQYKDREISISPAEPQGEGQWLDRVRNKYRKTNPAWRRFRKKVLRERKKQRRIWLYYDCKGVKKDNGYYQFIHDLPLDDGVQRWYVVNDDLSWVSDLFDRKQMKHVVRFGTDLHRLLYLQAEKVITAYVEWNNYLPFADRNEYNKFLDVGTDPEIIYLQHGVLHCHMPWKYSMDRLGIDKEVISTGFEERNLTENYCFSEDHLIPCGMPRYAHMDLSERPVNRILFAPSWRKYLVGVQDHQWITEESWFLESDFYRITSEFLNSPRLHDILEKNDFYLDFKLHPIFLRYRHLYHIENDRVTMAENTIKETDYRIFMTDMSSFVFDFIYLKKPVIYFLPDRDMFASGMNHYRQMDMPLDDAMGEYARTGDQACDALEHIFANDVKPLKKYAERMEGFFFHEDEGQEDRLSEALHSMDS